MNTTYTNMRTAFAKALIQHLFTAQINPLTVAVAVTLNKNVGVYKPKQMWNANLSFRTYQTLKKQGVMA